MYTIKISVLDIFINLTILVRIDFDIIYIIIKQLF